MTKLNSLQPSIGRLSSVVALATRQDQTRDRQRYSASPWRRWYGLKRWKDLRWSVLTDAMFQCVRCGRVDGNTSNLVADHKIPHRGREVMFWDVNNLQCLCKECHDSVKQREEQSEIIGVWD